MHVHSSPRFLKWVQGLARLWAPDQPWPTMRSPALLMILTGTTLVVGGIATASYRVVRGMLWDSLQQQALLQVQQGTSQIDQWLAMRKAEVTVLAGDPDIKSCDWSQVAPRAQAQLQNLPEFIMFNMTTADGMAYNTRVGKAMNVKDREFFQRAMAGETLAADPVVGRTTKQVQIQVSTPIRSPVSPTPRCVLMGAIKIDRVVATANQVRRGQGSYGFILNSKGVAIAHPNPKLIGTQEHNAASFLDASNPDLVAVARRMVLREVGMQLLQLDGQWVYIAYAPLQEANWSAALVIPQQELEAPLKSLNLLASMLALLLLLALVAVGWQMRIKEQLRDRSEDLLAIARELRYTMGELQHSVAEKDVLLKEVHHRVKNNLSVIVGLLRLQAKTIHDPQALAAFKDSQNRIHSMSLIHERLYQSKDLSRIDFRQYVQGLTSDILRSYRMHPGRVQLHLTIAPILFNVDIAIPCGLIINELLSNSFKYAFPGDQTGVVFVNLQINSSSHYVLQIGDNGIGLPDQVDTDHPTSLGWQLVQSLAGQIEATLQIQRSPGTIVTLIFPVTSHHPNLTVTQPEQAVALPLSGQPG